MGVGHRITDNVETSVRYADRVGGRFCTMSSIDVQLRPSRGGDRRRSVLSDHPRAGAERVETGPPSFVVMASQRSAMVALA